MKPANHRKSSTLFLILILSKSTSADQLQCLARINNKTVEGKTDNQGRSLPAFTTNATAITYELCVTECGTSQTPFQWTVFSQQSSSWLLPWLALIPQIPFGANDNLQNLETMLLTVGSPTLAGYSLALTVLNARWVKQIFAEYQYPNAQIAARILDGLQQAPLQIDTEDLTWLASLVVLPQNDDWWSELLLWLDYTHTWSISAGASIAWVIIAYVFTIVDYFSPGGPTVGNSNGQGVGSIGLLWLWLLGVVVGWLQVSPECDRRRLCQTVERANERAFVATSDPISGPCEASNVSGVRAISLRFSLPGEDGGENSAGERRDEVCTPPIFNYSRVFVWAQNVLVVANIFHNASERMRRHEPVVPAPVPASVEGLGEGEGEYLLSLTHRRSTFDQCRQDAARATTTQVIEYCLPRPGDTYGRNPRHPTLGMNSSVFSRIFMASVFGLILQWGTTGAAVVITWFTPTLGLGCRSASYIAYGVLSTAVWMMLLTSSLLNFYCLNASTSSTCSTNTTTYTAATNMGTLPVPSEKQDPDASPASAVNESIHRTPTRTLTVRVASLASILLRRTAKILAALNALWIVTLCLLQFGSFYDRCYCNSNVFGPWPYSRKDAPVPFDVIIPTHGEVVNMRNAWIGGFGLASVSTAFFAGFVGLLVG